MRVLVQHFGREDGGGFVNVATLFRTIIQNNPEDRFVIVCSESSLLCSAEKENNVDVVRIAVPRIVEFRRLQLLLRGLPKIVYEQQPDIVWSVNYGPYIRTGVPQVVSVINAFQVAREDVVMHHPRGTLHAQFMRWFSRRSLRASDGAIVETSLMRDHVRRIRGAPARILVAAKAVGPLEANTNKALPDKIAKLLDTKASKETFTFVYLAYPSFHKNHRTVIRAMEMLRAAHRPVRLALSLTPEELIAIGGERTEDLIQEGYILPLGTVRVEDLRAVYNACDACVMPSLVESLSSSHLEAMCWKKPQVCADLPYAHDVCGDASLFATAEDPADWAAKMQVLIDDKRLQNRLVGAGVTQMKPYPHTWKEVGRQVRDFLAEMAGRRRDVH